MCSVTDSAASTPTHATLQPHSSSSLEYSAASSSHSHSEMADADSPTNASSAAGAASSYAPVRRSKDKQKHSESENRRRLRLRAKFNALRDAAQCSKKDRFNILQNAVQRLQEQDRRIAELEAALGPDAPPPLAASASSNAASIPAAAAAAAPTMLPSLSTPLSNFQMLSALACCYISLDGRILDANAAFLKLFNFTASAGAAGGGGSGASSPASNAAASGELVPRADDLYSSSIFALTHHAELIHTLSILRNLLCGVMDCFECTKRCVTMGGGGGVASEMSAADLASGGGLGRQIECAMTIASVKNAGKTVMFLVIFVPRSSPPSGASGGVTPNAAHSSSANSSLGGGNGHHHAVHGGVDAPMSGHALVTPTTPSMLPSPQPFAPSLPLSSPITHGHGSTLPLHRPPRGVPHQPYARHSSLYAVQSLPSSQSLVAGLSHIPPSTPPTAPAASMLPLSGSASPSGFSLPSAAGDLGGRCTSMSVAPPPPTPLQIQPSTLTSGAAAAAAASAAAAATASANAAANSFLSLSSPGSAGGLVPSASPPMQSLQAPPSSAAPPVVHMLPELGLAAPLDRLTSLASVASGEVLH